MGEESESKEPHYEFDDSFVSPDIEEYISAVALRFCPNCGKEIVQTGIGRPRVFCSKACYREFWNKHPRPDAWKFYIDKTCPVCGKKFKAKKDGVHTKRFCSRACANKARGREFKERNKELENGEDNNK